MLLEDDSTSTSQHHDDEDDSAAAQAIYSRLDISPIHYPRRCLISGNNNMLIYSEPKSRLHHYSFDDCNDDNDNDSGVCDDNGFDSSNDNENNEAEDEEEDWTRTKHPSLMLFEQKPLLVQRRRRIRQHPPPPVFPSLLSSTTSSSTTTDTITETITKTDTTTDNTAGAFWRRPSQQLQQQQSSSSSSSSALSRQQGGPRRRLSWAVAFPRRRVTHPPIVRKRTRWLISATHPLKLCWDVLTVILSFANAYATHAAIRDREFGFTNQYFLRFCEVWFVVDILLNFCTTRQIQTGVILQTWQSVWARYLTSWFVIDILSLFPGEVLYIQPIIEMQKRRNLFQKWKLRSKAIARVTSRLVRGKCWIWARPALLQTKRLVGIHVVTTIRMLIYYIPKYLLFIRNMKGVIALRILRQIHWIRNIYLTWWTNRQNNHRQRQREQRTTRTVKKRNSSSSRLSQLSPYSLRQRIILRRSFGAIKRDDDTEILTEDSNTNNNHANPDWEFLRDDDPF